MDELFFLSCAVMVAWYKNLKLTIDYIWRNIFAFLDFSEKEHDSNNNFPVTPVTQNKDITG